MNNLFLKPLPVQRGLTLLVAKFNVNFLRIKIEEPTRSNCIWVIGLTTNYKSFKDSIQYQSISDAESLLNYIFSQNYTNIRRGDDFGSPAFRKIVYLTPVNE